MPDGYFHPMRIALTTIAVIIAIQGGCTSSSVNPPPDNRDSLVILPRQVIVFVGDTLQFRLDTVPRNDEVAWRVVSGSGTVSDDGLFSAPASLATDSATAVIEARTSSGIRAPGTSTITLLADTSSKVCFERDIESITRSSCALAGCHDAASRQSGYDFSRDAPIQHAVFAGEPLRSPMYLRVTHINEEKRMPPSPRPRLDRERVDAIWRWIAQGARITTCAPDVPCDTDSIRYATTIRMIMLSYCTACHEGARPDNLNIMLSSYAGVKEAANAGSLLGSVSHAPGYSPMPSSTSKIPECDVRRIRMWIAAGAPDN